MTPAHRDLLHEAGSILRLLAYDAHKVTSTTWSHDGQRVTSSSEETVAETGPVDFDCDVAAYIATMDPEMGMLFSDMLTQVASSDAEVQDSDIAVRIARAITGQREDKDEA